MTNCPRCQKPILNEGVFTSPAKFNIRCPWCQATLEINILPRIVTEVIKLGNGESYKKSDNSEANGTLARLDSARLAPDLNGANTHKVTPRIGNLTSLSPAPVMQNTSATTMLKSKPQAFKLVGYLYPEDENKLENSDE